MQSNILESGSSSQNIICPLDDCYSSSSDDFVEPRAFAALSRKRRRLSSRVCEFTSCIVCDAECVDDQHIDACLDGACPSSPRMSREVEFIGEKNLKSIENILGPSLERHAAALRAANIQSADDLLNIGEDIESFLRHSCQIHALGAVKKISLRVQELRSSTYGQGSNQSTALKNSTAVETRFPMTKLVSESSTAPKSKSEKNVWEVFTGNHRTASKLSSPPHRSPFRSTSSSSIRLPKPNHPFSKRVPGTSFVVDSFRAAGSDKCTRYFLTHFHSDHYQNLRKSTLPPTARVLCSAITASLVRSVLRVPENRIQILPSDGETSVDVEDMAEVGNGVTVYLYDANHCPGAVIMLFYVWKTKRYCLHTGDCRYDRSIFSKHDLLSKIVADNRLDYLYLDTTYASPQYSFPPQEKVLKDVVDAALKEDERTRHRCLYFFGTYSIGKEKVFLAVAEAMNLHIFTDRRKRTILENLGFGSRLKLRLVEDPAQARIHVVSMKGLSPDGLKAYCKRVGMNRSFIGSGVAVVFRPTGWTFRSDCSGSLRRSVRGADQAVAYDVAYSEHSSFSELKDFVAWTRPSRLIPTVNARSPADAEKLRTALGHKDKCLRIV